MPERDSVKIDLNADPSEALTGLDALNKSFEPLKELGKKLKEPLEILKRFTSVFFEIAGVVGIAVTGVVLFAQAVARASSGSSEAKQKIGELVKAIGELGRIDVSTTGFADLDKQIDEIVKRRAELSGSALNFDTSPEGAKRFKALSDELDQKQAEIEQRAKDRKARARAEERERTFQDAQRDTNALAEEGIDEEERIERARERGIERARVLRQQAEDDFQRGVADDYEEQIRAKAERDTQALRERRAAEEKATYEREQQEIKSAQRVAEAAAEAMQRELAAAFAQAGQALNAQINQANSKLTVTADNILRFIERIYVNQPTGGR